MFGPVEASKAAGESGRSRVNHKLTPEKETNMANIPLTAGRKWRMLGLRFNPASFPPGYNRVFEADVDIVSPNADDLRVDIPILPNITTTVRTYVGGAGTRAGGVLTNPGTGQELHVLYSGVRPGQIVFQIGDMGGGDPLEASGVATEN